MAPRFLAILSSSPELARETCSRIAASAHLSSVYDAGHLIVLASPDDAPVCLPNSQGVILGYLFSGVAPAHRIEDLPDREAQAIHASRGQQLIDAYWGGYVAFLVRPDRSTIDVVRDPSGAMPCLQLSPTSATKIFVSDIETLIESGLHVPEPDFPALAKLLMAYDLRTTETCLRGVRELPAGCRLQTSVDTEALTHCWTPVEHTPDVGQFPRTGLAETLRIVASGVIEAWAHAFDHPLLGVSGGLDSSVIASVMAGAGFPFILLTMATEEADGDERVYTRILSEALNIPVEERFHRIAEVDITRATSGHLPRPVLLAFGQSEHRQKLDLAKTRNIDAFFTGVGGDNVFCSLYSVAPLLDRMKAEGLTPGVFETASDLCRLTDCSVSELLRAAWKEGRKAPRYSWHTTSQFLSANALDQIDAQFDHPWLENTQHIGPGKREHIAMITRIQGTVDGFSRFDSPALINPLLSQPLVEFCLAIPTWDWVAGGRDRSLTRRGFATKLPKALVERRSKGTPNSFAFEVIDRNRHILRDHLIGGVLSSHGLLDLPALEHVLQPGRPLMGFDHMRLAALAEAEAWARLWTWRHAHNVRSRGMLHKAVPTAASL